MNVLIEDLLKSWNQKTPETQAILNRLLENAKTGTPRGWKEDFSCSVFVEGTYVSMEEQTYATIRKATQLSKPANIQVVQAALDMKVKVWKSQHGMVYLRLESK